MLHGRPEDEGLGAWGYETLAAVVFIVALAAQQGDEAVLDAALNAAGRACLVFFADWRYSYMPESYESSEF